MKLPSLPAGVRMLAYVVAISAVPVTLVFLVSNIGSTAQMRRQLLEMEADSRQHTARLEAAVQDISERIGDLSERLQQEMSSTRRDDQRDVARLGSRFARSFSSVQGKLDEMASQLKNNVLPETRAAAGPVVTAAPAALTVSASASAAPAEQDLRVLQKLREGNSFFESAEYSRAQRSYATVLALQPNNRHARLFYAASLYRTNPADTAAHPIIEKHLRSVLQNDSENPLALEILAMVAMERQGWSEAVDYLKRLVAVSPRSSAFLKTLGFCTLKTGDINAARDSFNSACLESPNDAEALAFLGDCESALGNTDKAEAAWKEALSTLDQRAPAGSRAGLALREKLARSAYDRGASGESLAYARDWGRQGQSALLRAYEGLCIVAAGNLREGRSILEEVSASNDEQAAALARSGLEENGR